MAQKTIGYAVVGLGHIAQSQVLPAFAAASENSRLVALVSGDEEKRRELGKQYGVKALYDYADYDECLAHEEVDAVYIALPNDLHEEYTVRAAKAGVHVLCEKPLALSEAACQRMIDACRDADVKLMAAYRLHFEPSNLRAIERILAGDIGDPRFFQSSFGYQLKADNIRGSKRHGGGPLWDLGVYCVNATRYVFRDEPIEVFAWTLAGKDERFEGVEAAASVVMKFPRDRLASFTCSFAVARVAEWTVVGTDGVITLENGYEYGQPRKLIYETEEGTEEERFLIVDQFAPELITFSRCVLEDLAPEPSGEEGLADVRIIEAIYRSAREGRPVALEPRQPKKGPTPDQRFRIPLENRPEEEVHAESPSG